MTGKKETELNTVRVMIEMFCRQHHRGGGLCGECRGLLDYVGRRIEKCPHGDLKPACSRCEVHCFKPPMRRLIRDVMRFAGPRMIWRHPVLAIRHSRGK